MFKNLSLVLACLLVFSVAPVMAQETTTSTSIDYCKGNFNYDKDVDGTDASLFKSDFGRSGLIDPCPPDGPSPVPRTGSRISMYEMDDGDLQHGLPSPNPRFTNHGNGTVTDNLTGLMWTRDAFACGGARDWTGAMDCVASYNTMNFGGYSDWVLPNLKELLSLVDYGRLNPALPSGHPFTNVQTYRYWSSTSSMDDYPGSAWFVGMSSGWIGYPSKTEQYCVWPVRAARAEAPEPTTTITTTSPTTTTSVLSYPAPVAKTGRSSSLTTGDDGDLERGVEWPNPRFTNNADGTVTDNLTGLIWLKNAACFGVRNWFSALDDCAWLSDPYCGLSDGSSSGDWRLPNLFELESLRSMQYYNPALSNAAGTGHWSEGDAFTNVQSNNYWSSTTTPGSTYINLYAWAVDLTNGSTTSFISSTYNYVWPVRGGQ